MAKLNKSWWFFEMLWARKKLEWPLRTLIHRTFAFRTDRPVWLFSDRHHLLPKRMRSIISTYQKSLLIATDVVLCRRRKKAIFEMHDLVFVYKRDCVMLTHNPVWRKPIRLFAFFLLCVFPFAWDWLSCELRSGQECTVVDMHSWKTHSPSPSPSSPPFCASRGIGA